MSLLSETLPHACSLNQHCWQWARIYLNYCLCSAKDGMSLALGLVSVVSWGVAEVPQIITNYKEKSMEGLSIAFLMTWIIGDLFNLIGCLLEPTTLPTQFYMALLYTTTTVILTAQTVYYGHIYHRLKANKDRVCHKSHRHHQEDEPTKERLLGYNIDDKETRASNYQANGSNPVREGMHMTSSPIPVTAPVIGRYGSYGRDLYYMSARSLSKSPIPTAGSWLAHLHHYSRTALNHDRHSSQEPLVGRLVPQQSAPLMNTKNMLSVVPSVAFLLGIYSIHLFMKKSFNASPHPAVILVGRKLLQDQVFESPVRHGDGSRGIGNLLGWAMAAIYMGGRLPQICLNIRRGNVEGLNPLMFIFAVIGNTTYVGSIIVNSLDWSRIRPNLPWLVDAGGCVLLDAFILLQFLYFHLRKPIAVASRNNQFDSS
ncbi:uncharacterized protein LOC103719251 [Phoenix dactylifera]|uniref:Uncharacterized protein LOC103719251 n=1 Tax=Phoenix dactylifera TaxID=42345 RepID=A0A8B7MWM4_PHODC|nr:uncharacterized protein LOC103719251 [Phoenix dactylifera]